MAKEKPQKAGLAHEPGKKATPPAESSQPAPVRVYLSSKDKYSLEEIAKTFNVSRRMLLSYAVRSFLASYRAGHIKLDPTMEAGRAVLNVNIPLDNMDA